MWQVLRLGLVRAPEIELQDIKLRNRTSPSNINDDNNNKGTKKHGHKIEDLLVDTQKRENKISNEINKNGGGIFGNCKCSIGVIEPIIMPPRSIRPNYSAKTGISGPKNNSLGQFVSLKEDKELAQKKKGQHQQQQAQKQQQQHQQQRNREKEVRQGKRVGSHHRTFEWVRDLSHTSVLNS